MVPSSSRAALPRRLALMLAVALAAAASALTLTAASANAAVVYDNIPGTLPGNFASFGNEAYSNAEFGGLVEFPSIGFKKQAVTVAMSAWACQEGNISEDTCKTPEPSKKFKWPITLSIYEVGPENSVGPKLASVTKKFKMPYRPTANDGICVPKGFEAGTWYDAAVDKCFHGMAFTISFKALKIQLRKREIITVTYNTSDHGPAPVGALPCRSTKAGCYYDSLNIATTEPFEGTLTVGSDPTKSLYLNSTYAAMYCGSSTPVGTFGPTAPIEGTCASGSPYETEAGIQPAFSVAAN
ncbi:MAG TPA: hypothetical protein VGX51_00655 [Solirubrobacteraceae bacterium]|jgi:hypothetical protein|nr:hypothetical protein [Solirubrobacteraceae bacterium]